MTRLSYILFSFLLFPLMSWTHPIPNNKKTWLIYGSAGLCNGMQEWGQDFQFGLAKSTDKWTLLGDFHFNSYSNSTVFRFNANMGTDLLRLNRRKRNPYCLVAYAGIGLTHLSNTSLTDSFLLKGDDMLNFSVGIQPRYMFTKNFGLISDINFNQNFLLDFNLNNSVNFNLGLVFKIK